MDDYPIHRMLTHFNRWTLGEHVKAAGRRLWKRFLLTACLVFGGYWGIAEAFASSWRIDLAGGLFFLVGAILSVVSAGAVVLRGYLSVCPEGLENESHTARRIALLRRPQWEFRLARCLLDEKLTALDDELAGLLAGRTLVPIERHIRVNDYGEWAMARIGTLKRTMHVATQLLIHDFPEAVRSTPDHVADPRAIVAVVDDLEQLYAQAVDFERSHHAVEPDDVMRTAHSLLRGWTEPIRDGIHQLEGFLDKLMAVDPHQDSRVQYEIVFKAPPNVKEFSMELDRVLEVWMESL